MKSLKERWKKANNADKVVVCLQGANVVLAVVLTIFRILIFKEEWEDIMG